MSANPSVPVWVVHFWLESRASEPVSLETANGLMNEVTDAASNYVEAVYGHCFPCFPCSAAIGERIGCLIELMGHVLLDGSRPPDIDAGIAQRLLAEWLPEACARRGWTASGWYWHGAWTHAGAISIGGSNPVWR